MNNICQQNLKERLENLHFEMKHFNYELEEFEALKLNFIKFIYNTFLPHVKQNDKVTLLFNEVVNFPLMIQDVLSDIKNLNKIIKINKKIKRTLCDHELIKQVNRIKRFYNKLSSIERVILMKNKKESSDSNIATKRRSHIHFKSNSFNSYSLTKSEDKEMEMEYKECGIINTPRKGILQVNAHIPLLLKDDFNKILFQLKSYFMEDEDLNISKHEYKDKSLNEIIEYSIIFQSTIKNYKKIVAKIITLFKKRKEIYKQLYLNIKIY